MKRILALAAVVMFAAAPAFAELQKPAVRKPASGFSLPGRDGKAVKLSSLKGKVVLLDFWATWCTGCKVEIPWFIEFDKAYRAQGLSALGVAMDDEGWQKVEPYLKQHPISYPVVAGSLDSVAAYEIGALPITVLIDRSGRVAARHIGVVDKKMFEAELKQLLAEKP
jgi:cytochrome c biogenesis protein CcmG/thiol:disulfide interchange protein DsbE